MFFPRIAQYLTLALCLLSVSCTHTPQDTSAVVYSICDDAGDLPVLADSECLFIPASLDYGRDGAESISLFVRKFPARRTGRGAIVLLAGGPGESGASFYADIDFFRDVFAGYDLIVPDHRGTGYSTKLCEPEETRASEGGLDLVGEEWGSCFGALYSAIDRTQAFNLDNAAQDVAAIIDVLGLGGGIYIYGVSYGTSLAIAVAERTDADLSGLILDSLTPLPTDQRDDLSHRSHSTDRVGRVVLKRCAADPVCPLGQGAPAVYADLLRRIDAGETVTGLGAIPNSDLRQFMGLLLDVPAARRMIPVIIAAMASGDEAAGDLVQEAIQTYEAFWSPILALEQARPSIPLSGIMSGSEFNTRNDLTPEQVAAEKSGLGFTSPLPGLLANNRFPLYEPSTVASVNTDLPPVLVLQGTLDPKTPYEAALRRVETLRTMSDVAVVTLIDAPHAAYFASKDCLGAPLREFVRRPSSLSGADCAPSEARLQWRQAE